MSQLKLTQKPEPELAQAPANNLVDNLVQMYHEPIDFLRLEAIKFDRVRSPAFDGTVFKGLREEG